jgi:tRNA modification GTPase
LKKSKEFLVKAKETIANNFTGEFIAVDLRNAESALGEIIGKVTTDDILNNIFDNFCIGK